jgi:hypothetical protein
LPSAGVKGPGYGKELFVFQLEAGVYKIE